MPTTRDDVSGVNETRQSDYERKRWRQTDGGPAENFIELYMHSRLKLKVCAMP